MKPWSGMLAVALGICMAVAAGTGEEPEARALNRLGIEALEAGRQQEALSLFQRSAEAARAVGDSEGEIFALYNAGRTLLGRGEAEGAATLLEQALLPARRLDSAALAGPVHVFLGQAYGSLGDAAAAILHHRRALSLLDVETQGRGRADVLSALGLEYLKTGLYTRAAATLEEALRQARELELASTENAVLQARLLLAEQSFDARLQASAAADLRDLALRLEDPDLAARAAASLERARLLLEPVEDPGLQVPVGEADAWIRDLRWRQEGFALRELAGTYLERLEIAVAAELYRESLELARTHGDREGEGLSLERLGILYLQTDTAHAAARFEELVAFADRGADPLLKVRARVLLGNALALGGDVRCARSQLRDGQNLAARLGGPETVRLRGEIEGLLGLLAMTEGEFLQAATHWERESDLARRAGNSTPQLEALRLENLARAYAAQGRNDDAMSAARSALTHVEKGGQVADRAAAHDALGFVLYKAGRLPEAETTLRQAMELYESLWAAAPEEDLLRVALQDRYSPPYELLQQVLVEHGEVEEALEIAERGRAQAFAAALSRLTRHAATAPAPPDLGRVLEVARQAETALVLYSLIYDPARLLAASRFGGAQGELERWLYIWVVTPRGEVRFERVDLRRWRAEHGSSLADLVRRGRSALEQRGRGLKLLEPFAHDPEEQARQALRDLYEILVTPIAAHLPTEPGARVAFIPQGTLFLVPIAALPGPDGEPLLSRWTPSVAPSIDILHSLPPARRGVWAGEEVLVVGDPALPPGLPVQLRPLPGAEREARAVALRFGARPLVGSEATQEAVVRAMPGARLLHFASHGLLEGGDASLPGALVLASGGDGGLLTAADIAGMRLRADLVVLSACDTGGGRLTGDGVLGLARSFLTAGASAVVVSLWQIDDAATTFLMERFYQRLATSGDGARALREAMLATREGHPAPALWSAFIYVGR